MYLWSLSTSCKYKIFSETHLDDSIKHKIYDNCVPIKCSDKLKKKGINVLEISSQ